jgi:hypothetical protein
MRHETVMAYAIGQLDARIQVQRDSQFSGY